MKVPSLLHNKSVMVGLIIVGCVLLIAVLSSLGGAGVGTPSPLPLSSPSRLEIVDLNEERRRQAAEYRRQIIDALPIYVPKLTTSVGIDTAINVYTLPDDPVETVRLEIYGLSYLNNESDPAKNPNITAFEESYREALRLIRDKNIDPKRLIFIYGDKEYVRETTEKWLKERNLHP